MPSPAEPSPLQLPALARVEKWLRLLVAVSAAGFILLFLYTALRRMHYPFSLDQIEGNMLTTVWRVAHGLPIYTSPTPDFVPYLYTPLYYYLAAALAKLTGVSYVALRLLSILGTVGSMGVIYAFVYSEVRSHLPSLAAAGLYAVCYDPLQGWFDIGRTDSLSIFFFLLAIYCTRRRPILVATLAWVLAFQTKQGILPIALLIYCADFTRPRRMLLGIGSLSAGIGLSVLLLNHATGGWYNFYVFGSTRGLGWLWRQAVFYVPVDLLLPFGIAFLLMLAAVFFVPPALKNRGAHFFLLTTFAVYAGIWYLRAHKGSSANTLMPAFAWTAVLFGLAFGRLQAWLHQRQGTYAQACSVLLLAAVTIQLASHLYNPGRYVPSAAVRQDHQLLIDQIHAIPGDIYVLEHSDDALFAGKPQHAIIDSFGLITEGPPSAAAATFASDFNNAVQAHQYKAFVLDETFTPEHLAHSRLPADLFQYYPVRIPALGNAVGDVTSTQPREKWIFLPCSALDQDLTGVIPPGGEVSYGNCPNAPQHTPAQPSTPKT